MDKDLNLITTTAVPPLGSTDILMILDRSGSMAGKEADVIGGFNSIVTRFRNENVSNCSVTYVRFDNIVEPVFTEELVNVPELTPALYTPRANTALLDAVGQTVAGVTNNPDNRYIVITFTDGQENASHEWTKEKVAVLLKEREAFFQCEEGLLLIVVCDRDDHFVE